MIVSANNTPTLCLNCIAFVDEPRGQAGTCASCGFQIAPQEYEILVCYGLDAAEYGYHYRRAYEEDLASDELGSQYSLGIDEAWGFIALAVVSGLIGNLSTDVVKALVQRLKRSFEKRRAEVDSGPTLRLVENQLSTLNDETEVEFFINYISDYYQGLEGVDPRVIPYILEEMRAGARTRAFMELIRNGQGEWQSLPSRELLDAEIARQQALRAAARQLSPCVFEALWQAAIKAESGPTSIEHGTRSAANPDERPGGQLKASKARRLKTASVDWKGGALAVD